MDSDSIKQLEDIHHKTLIDNSSSISSTKMVVVDIDQSGLIANGKTYELADKGYFAKKKIKGAISYLLLLRVKPQKLLP
jgi:hypothetical protein